MHGNDDMPGFGGHCCRAAESLNLCNDLCLSVPHRRLEASGKAAHVKEEWEDLQLDIILQLHCSNTAAAAAAAAANAAAIAAEAAAAAAAATAGIEKRPTRGGTRRSRLDVEVEWSGGDGAGEYGTGGVTGAEGAALSPGARRVSLKWLRLQVTAAADAAAVARLACGMQHAPGAWPRASWSIVLELLVLCVLPAALSQLIWNSLMACLLHGMCQVLDHPLNCTSATFLPSAQ